MTTHDFELDLTPTGAGARVVINGQNLADCVMGVDLTAQAGRAPILVLSVPFPGKVVGHGLVLQNVGGISAEDLLGSLTAEELEQQVNDSMANGLDGNWPETVGQAMMAVLAHRADELEKETDDAGGTVRTGSDSPDE